MNWRIIKIFKKKTGYNKSFYMPMIKAFKKGDYDKLRSIYNIYLSTAIKGNGKSRLESRYKDVLNFTNGNIGKCLDIGVGDATITNFLSTKFNTTIDAIDVMDSRVSNFENVNFRLYNGEDLPQNTYDTIFCFMCIHHIKNKEKVLKQIFNMLNKDGILIIREHDAQNKNDHIFLDIIHDIYDNVFNGYPTDVEETRVYLSKNELDSMLTNIGFNKIKHYDCKDVYMSFMCSYQKPF